MDEYFMKQALKRAEKAAQLGEVPVGAVIVSEGKIVSSGYNRREGKKNALLHAELIAIHRACQKLGRWRLSGCTLYVTLEPCPMCAGAIINSRIDRVVFGCNDPKAGATGSVVNLNEMGFNHRFLVESGVLQDECSGMLTDFFRNLRKKDRVL